MKKILITGCNGLVGTHLVKKCTQMGFDVIGVDITPLTNLQSVNNFKFIQADLTQGNVIENIFNENNPDAVFNTFGVKGSPLKAKNQPVSFLYPSFKINTEIINQCSKKQIWLVFVSSVGVYAPAEKFVEDSVWSSLPSESDWYPSWSKRMGELLLEAYKVQYNYTNWAIIRPANIFGEYDDFEGNGTVIASTMKKVFEATNEIEAWGDGTPIRDFVYAGDVADAIIDLYVNDKRITVNFGAGQEITIKQMIDTVIKVSGKSLSVKWDSSKPNGDMRRQMDITKQKENNLLPKLGFENAISETYSHYVKTQQMINKNSKILITGGSGLVGQNLTNKLVNEGYRDIRVTIHRKMPRNQHLNVEYMMVDLETREGSLEATKNVDVVFHCAASTSNAVDTVVDPLAHVTPNVAMNNFLIDAAWRNKVKKYIFISSNTIYPPKGNEPVVETDFVFSDIYPVYFPVGWMKRYAEIQCELYSKYLPEKMVTVIVRPANLFGPHDKYDFNKCHVTPATIRKVADKMNPIPVWGDGQEVRDLLYIDDFVDALQLIMEKQDTHDVFNIGSNKGYTVNDVLSTMKSVAGYDAPIEYVSGKPSMIPVRYIDSNKIKNMLGWEPKTELSVGLKKAYDWYLINKEEFI